MSKEISPAGADLPLQWFDVAVTRESFGSRTARVQARDEDDAREKALDDAGNHLYSEKDARYVVDCVAPAPTPVERERSRS